MAAHSYFRFLFAAIDGGSVLTLAEVELRTSIGGADAATGGTASASTGTAANAFDNNNATNWAATGQTTGWLQYLFASPVDIIEHAITAPAATMTNAPKNYSLQYSDDGANWTTAAIVGGQTGWSSNEQRVFTHSSYPVSIGVNVRLAQLMPVVTITPPATSVKAVLRSEAALQPSPMLSGIVKQNGVPCARTVRAYNRNTGEILGETVSDAITGAFSINARGYTDFCYCLCLDDLTLAPDYNAAIYDLVLPV